MFPSKGHVFTVSIQRRGPSSPWGISIIGGADQGSPIIVTKVTPGSPCERKLKEGDEIKKIEEYDARDITHQNVHSLFQKAGTTIRLVVKRDSTGKKFPSANDSVSTPFSLRPQVSLTNIPYYEPASPGSPKSVSFAPSFSTQRSQIYDYGIAKSDEEDTDAELVRNQPYRTTPLVLPGAKAKHEAPTGSYLRHHPNPMMRSGPSQYEYLPHDVAMKQRVADSILTRIEKDEALAGKQIVRKQFNTPIGLYSDKNIVDTIQYSTGINPGLSRSPSFGRQNQGMGPRKNVVYDPSKSETFKALQEEQYGDGPMHEITVPAHTKVFNPTKQPPQQRLHQPAQVHTYDPSTLSSAPQHHHLNSMGHPEDHIAQSGSFKRLMNMVLPENY